MTSKDLIDRKKKQLERTKSLDSGVHVLAREYSIQRFIAIKNECDVKLRRIRQEVESAMVTCVVSEPIRMRSRTCAGPGPSLSFSLTSANEYSYSPVDPSFLDESKSLSSSSFLAEASSLNLSSSSALSSSPSSASSFTLTTPSFDILGDLIVSIDKVLETKPEEMINGMCQEILDRLTLLQTRAKAVRERVLIAKVGCGREGALYFYLRVGGDFCEF